MQALRDPIHRNILLEPWAVDLIDSRELQRLRRVRQLGTAYLVYPGANHTRFEHSLGAHKLAQDATRAFGLAGDEARTIEAAALLHDVGHGPMSHLFEEVAIGKEIHHEEFGVDLIRWSGLADRLRSHGIDPNAVADLVVGKGPRSRIVSGDIDVDRMDYLVRDAHYTGVRASVDPERILHTLTLAADGVLVREEGVTSVEALLLARFLMYPAIYFHHTCRSAEAMLIAAIRDLVDQGAQLNDLRTLDDFQLLNRLEAATGFARDVAVRIQERRLFKRAFEGTHAIVEADEFLQQLVKDPKRRTAVERELAQECGLRPREVIVDAPRLPMVREVEARVLRKDGEVVSLREASTLVRTLLQAQRDHWRFWVFAPKDYVDSVQRAFTRRLAAKTIKPGPGLAAHP